VVTRRALLGAGAVALFAGCGPEEEPKVDVEAVLSEQMDALQAVLGAYDGVPLTGALRASAEERIDRIAAALEPFRGDGPSAAAAAQGGTGRQAALDAETAALRAHVAAVGQLEAREYRELLAGLIIDAASNQSALLILIGRPPAPTAFPGQPV
jgi:hypothetical protein